MPDFDTMLKEKDTEIEKLKKELEVSKRGSTQVSYAALVKKIDVLQKEVDQRNEEIAAQKKVLEDLQKNSSAGDLQTKIIVLQSKIRQKDIKIRDLTEDLNKKDKKVEALEKIAQNESGGENINALKAQNQELETQVKSLRQQMVAVGEKADKADALQQALLVLQQELSIMKSASPAPARVQSVPSSAGMDPAQIAALQGEIRKRDEQIASLQQQLAASPSDGGVAEAAGPAVGAQISGASYMSQRRSDQKVRELESQVEMLKRSETQMRQQYQEAVRKLASKDELSW